VTVAALRLRGTETIQYGGLGLIEIWQAQDRFPVCAPLEVQLLLCHRQRPPEPPNHDAQVERCFRMARHLELQGEPCYCFPETLD
jgi:hypothetical protein